MKSPKSRSNSDVEPQPVTENKADVYRKQAFKYKEAGKNCEALAENSRTQLLATTGLTDKLLQQLSDSRKKSLEQAMQQFNRSSDCLKDALHEDKKNKNTIDEVKDHFELAEIYMIKKKFGKAIQHALKGLELNLAKEPKQKSHIDEEDRQGLRILGAGLTHIPENSRAIPYYEQTIAMFGKLGKKYPLVDFKARIEGTQFNLELLQELPFEDAPRKSYRVLSDRNNGNKENTPMPKEHGFKRKSIFSPLVENYVFSPVSVEVVLEPVEQPRSPSNKKNRVFVN